LAGGERLTCLRVELDDALLQRALLHLQALLRRDHVSDALLHVLQLFGLLLVAVVQRLGRVFSAIEQLRDLRLHDCGHAPRQAGHLILLLRFTGQSRHASIIV